MGGGGEQRWKKKKIFGTGLFFTVFFEFFDYLSKGLNLLISRFL